MPARAAVLSLHFAVLVTVCGIVIRRIGGICYRRRQKSSVVARCEIVIVAAVVKARLVSCVWRISSFGGVGWNR